jgi:predicted DNA-binding protein
MYTYIVERTQIYLSKAQAAALDREASRLGTTRSHLIREAIEARYGSDDEDEFERVKQILENAKGMCADRTESGAEYVDRLRAVDAARLQEKIQRSDDEPAGHDDPD